MKFKKAKSGKVIWLFLVFVALEGVLAIHDPAFTGIKTRAYHRDPLIAEAYKQRTTTHHGASYLRHGDVNNGLSAPAYGSYNANPNNNDNNFNARIQEQEQPIHVQPIFERSHQQSNSWQDAENSITEYFTGCPPQHTGPLPYAYDCRRFVNCFKGRGHIQSCGPGTVFNPQTLECDRPDKVLCGANAALSAQSAKQRAGRLLDLEPHCPPGVNGLQPHPSDCTKFLNCANGQMFVQDCAPGTAYSVSMMGCDYKEKVDCGDRGYGVQVSPVYVHRTTGSTNDIVCPPSDNRLHPHPYDRKKYLNCARSSAPLIESCNPGTEFDSLNLVCVLSAQDQSVLTQAPQRLVSSFEHNADILCPTGVVGFFAHPFDNTKFLHCKSAKMSVQSCIAGHVFSISMGHCVPRQQAHYSDYVSNIVSEVSYGYCLMTTSCPPGTDGMHLYPYDGQKYLSCSNGKMSVINCAVDMAYSISNKACRPKTSVSQSDRVKYYWEIPSQVTVASSSANAYSYGQTHSFESSITQCPRSATGLYPYSFDGSKYILCQNGLMQIESCPSGHVFSLSKKQCWLRTELLDKDFVNFYGSLFIGSSTANVLQDLTSVACPPSTRGYYLHPFDCTKYINCGENELIVGSCPSGSVYSISQRKCVARDQVVAFDRVEYLTETQNEFFAESSLSKTMYDREKSAEEVALAPHGEASCRNGDSGLQPHPYDCSKFLNCANGQTYVQSCGPGTAWSIELEVCDLVHKVDCSTRFGFNAGHLQNSNSQHVKCPVDAYGLYAHPFDYTRFLRCESGRTSVQGCYKGAAFSISRSYCLPLREVAATDRVAFLSLTGVSVEFNDNGHSGGVGGFVFCPEGFEGSYLYPFDCTRYISCSRGLTLLLECAAGTHFSISHGTCLATVEVDRHDRVSTRNEVQELLNWQRSYATRKDYVASAILCPLGILGTFQHPFEPSKFLSCEQAETLVFDCQPKKVFSVSRRMCFALEEVPQSDRVGFSEQHDYTQSKSSKNFLATPTSTVESADDVRCAANESGMQAHPYDCTKYLNCANGVTHVQDCGPGTAWHTQLKLCDFIQNVNCSNRQGRVLVGPNIEVHSSTEVTCPPGASGVHPHLLDCTKFLNCAEGRTFVQDCAPGTAWNVQLEVCDYIDKVDCGDRRSDLAAHRNNNENREPKAYDTSNLESSSDAERTTTIYADRWTNMNMQRPSGVDFGYNHKQVASNSAQNTASPAWSGHGSHIDFQAPTQSVLYVEGSLEPNRNYMNTMQTYHTPLAPFSPSSVSDIYETTPTSTNLYYAQPVDSQENILSEPQSDLRPRWNYSREINYMPQANAGWKPILKPSRYSPPSSTLPQYPDSTLPQLNTQLMPPFENQLPKKLITKINLDDLPDDRQFVLSEQDQYASASKPDASNLYGGLQPPKPSPNHSDINPRQRPSYSDNPYPNHRPTYADVGSSNLYGGLQPPPPENALTTPLAATTTPSSVLQIPSKSTQPSNVRTFQIYPPLSNATRPNQPNYPHYSPPYSGVVHSRNASWSERKLPTKQDIQKPEVDDDFAVLHTISLGSQSPDRHGFEPPPHNTKYYNRPYTPSEREPHRNSDEKEDIQNLPISEALRMLLRPYFNRSGTINESVAERAESHIMSVVGQPSSSLRTTTTTTNKPIPTAAPTPKTMTMTSNMTSMTARTAITSQRPRQEDAVVPPVDVELILAGEQESLRNTITTPTNGETHNKKTEFHLNQPPATPTDNSNNWHKTNGHSRGFHQRHPNLPNPFVDDSLDSTQSSKAEAKTSSYHNHHHNQHQHQHSRAYHSSHPEIPSPFENSGDETRHHHWQKHSRDFHERHPSLPNHFKEDDKDDSFDDDFPNPNAESTTLRTDRNYNQIGGISNRGNFNDRVNDVCEFNCGGGKCVKQIEVCDGVNNCGNHKDESQCDHLGYEVRLTGGESPHMGRVEVKVLGKWGYVCDDKFGLRDADVACKELGFDMGASEVRGNSYYPPAEASFSYAMDEVECRGNETKLKDCEFKGWGVNNCGPDEVVGVVCKVPQLKCPNNYWLCSTSKECIPPAFVCDNTEDCSDKSDESEQVCNSPIEYRLEGGRSANEGRLEVKYRGEWGTICDDDFSLKEAQVACNALGFYGPPKIEKNIFGLSNGPIWLDQVSCVGNESSIDKCNHWTWGEHNCNHTEDVGLHCTVGPPPRRSTTLFSVGGGDTTAGQQSEEDAQTALEDIGIYTGWERASKAIVSNQRRCGHFKDDLLDEYAHPEQRVVNGTVAKRGRHPWQATIRTRGRGGISSHWCGAVLISKRHLLTAAHCLVGYPKGSYFVRMGDHYANIAEASEVDSYIENWYIHEKFRDKSHMNNDIALIVLKTPVKFNDYVQPICLPDKGAKLVENRMCTISGWGSIKSGISTPSNILRAAQLPILPDETCKQSHVYGNALTEGMFCAGSMDESVDACDGDSGGPLVCSDDDGETLYGIISWGQHCGYVNKPGVYVRVQKYVDWIYEKINYSIQQLASR